MVRRQRAQGRHWSQCTFGFQLQLHAFYINYIPITLTQPYINAWFTHSRLISKLGESGYHRLIFKHPKGSSHKKLATSGLITTCLYMIQLVPRGASNCTTQRTWRLQCEKIDHIRMLSDHGLLSWKKPKLWLGFYSKTSGVWIRWARSVHIQLETFLCLSVLGLLKMTQGGKP